jgi:hypothetical protein
MVYQGTGRRIFYPEAKGYICLAGLSAADRQGKKG